MTRSTYSLLFGLIFIFGVGEALAQEEGEKKGERYLTPEDKRDASLGKEIADGFLVSWLVETESQRLWEDYGDSHKTFPAETAYNVQLAAEIELAEWAVLELVGEAEKELEWRSQLEEGILALEWEDWSADIGRLYVPFGEYYSQFISDIALEAGETRGTGLALDYNWGDSVELSLYFVHHDDDRVNEDKKDWGMGMVYQAQTVDVQLGLAYLSAFPDDDDDVREIYDSNEKLTNAWTASALVSLEPWLFTLEVLQADRDGLGLPKKFQHFVGFNTELGYYGIEHLRISLRRQENRGVLASPAKQVGWGINWISPYNFSLTYEHMWNDYEKHDDLDIIKGQEINFGMVIEF